MSYIVGVPAGLGGDPLIPVQNIHGLRRVGGATRGVIREEADACQIGDPGFCRRGCFADCWSGPPRLMVLWGLQKASAGISFDALVAALRATSPTALLGSLAATFLSFVALLGYDLSGLRYTGARPPVTAALLASFCGFAIGNTVGLGAFSGGAVRYRLYSAAGLSPGQMRASYSLSRSPTASDSQRSPEPCATLQRGLRNCVPCAVSWHFIRLRIGPTVTIPGRDRPCLEQKRRFR